MSDAAGGEARGTFNPLNIFGWVLGGLSVLNLVHDLSPLKLYGLVKDWAESYESLAERAGAFLFGWIDWHWISIDRNEIHVIVLAILLASATMRASYRTQMKNGRAHWAAFFGAAFAAFLVILLPVLLAAALLPGIFGLIGSAAYLPFAAWEFGFSNTEADDSVPASRDVRQEFLGVLAVFALLVALNYSLIAVS